MVSSSLEEVVQGLVDPSHVGKVNAAEAAGKHTMVHRRHLEHQGNRRMTQSVGCVRFEQHCARKTEGLYLRGQRYHDDRG